MYEDDPTYQRWFPGITRISCDYQSGALGYDDHYDRPRWREEEWQDCHYHTMAAPHTYEWTLGFEDGRVIKIRCASEPLSRGEAIRRQMGLSPVPEDSNP